MEMQDRLAPSSWALGSGKQNGKVLLKSARVIKSLLVLVISRGDFITPAYLEGHAVEVMAAHEYYLFHHLEFGDQTQVPQVWWQAP